MKTSERVASPTHVYLASRLSALLVATFVVVATGGNGCAGEPESIEPPITSSTTCDARYRGVCVPIATDVDCVEGKGNGPSYFRGPAAYEGTDPYGLDRDRDGILCEPYPE